MAMTGCYRTPSGWRVVACIGRGKGKRLEKHFPADASERTRKRWQEEARAALRQRPTVAPGSLEADVATYLAARAAMPTAKDRARILRLWVVVLGGTRPRHAITPIEIRTVLERWRVAGSSAGTCNRRRTALQSFFTVLNGKSGTNPVRDVPKMREPEQPPRKIDYPTFAAIDAALQPSTGRRLPGESPAPGPSQTLLRLRVMAYTGLPPAQVALIRPEHLLAAERLLLVQGRHKGAGTASLWLPLADVGVQAVAGLIARKACGPFSRRSLYTSFKRAAVKVGRPDLRPYDLRHLFGQTLLRVTRNRAATRDLLLHRSDKTTQRYTASEIPGELRAALAQFDAAVVADRCGEGRTEAERIVGKS